MFMDLFFCHAHCPVSPIQCIFHFKCVLLQEFPLGHFYIIRFSTNTNRVRDCLYFLEHMEHVYNSGCNVLVC